MLERAPTRTGAGAYAIVDLVQAPSMYTISVITPASCSRSNHRVCPPLRHIAAAPHTASGNHNSGVVLLPQP